MDYKVESDIGLNLGSKLPPQTLYKESILFDSSQTSSYMKKIKDNISNHSKTSRDYSSLISSSNDSDSEKKSKTLQNLSESYIKQLSKKLNQKTSQSLKDGLKLPDSTSNYLALMPKRQTEPALTKNLILNNVDKNTSEESKLEPGVVDEGNPLIKEGFLPSGDTTKKELSQIDYKLAENKIDLVKKKPINILKMIKHVSVAINKLRNRTQYRNLKFVTDEQIDLINDSTWFSERTGRNRDQLKMLLAENIFLKYFYKSKIIFKRTKIFAEAHKAYKFLKLNLFNKVGVIEPDHKLKMVFDFLIIILIVFLFFLFPLQISFDFYLIDEMFPSNPVAQEFLSVFIMVLLLLDIILKFFTGYYENGISVLQKDKIFKNYIQHHLIFDIVAFLPVFLMNFRNNRIGNTGIEQYTTFIKLSEFLIIFKAFEVLKALQTLEEMLHMNEQSEALFELFKLITKILLFCHILACSWHAVAYYSPYHANLISENVEISHANWLTKYLNFLYWTIAIEKIEPKNDLELFFGFFALLGSSAVMGFIIEGIHSILDNLTRASNIRRESIRVINRYMRRKNIEYDIQVKVRKYLNFIYDQDSANAAKENELIDKLSTSLREEVLIRANGNILKMIPLFYRNFSENTLRKLVFSMKQVRFYPEEIIFQENDIDDRSIFLISDGEIELYRESGGNLKLSIKKLKKGNFFGEISFFTDVNRSSSCISSNFSTVYAISRNDFLSIIKENPDDYEKFRMLSDKILNYQSYEDLYIKCHACNRNDHTIERCPFLHFIPQREFLICRHLFNRPTVQRDPFDRKKKRSGNPRANIMTVQRKMKDFLSSLNLEQESGDEFSETDSSEDDDNFDGGGGAGAGAGSGSGIIINSQTKINNPHPKKSVLITEPLPSSGVIRNPIKELSSVIELDKDEDEMREVSREKDKNYEKKITSDVYETTETPFSHHLKRATMKSGFEREREPTFKHEKSMEREVSRKYSVYPDIEREGRTAFSRGERERTTKIASGVYPPTSMVTENKNDMYMKEMDRMTIFNYYFPHNNADNVLKKVIYKRLGRRSTKYAKIAKFSKNSRKTRKSTKNLAKELSNLGLAIRLPSMGSEMKGGGDDTSFLAGFSPPNKNYRPKKSFFTENDEPRKEDAKK